MKRKRIYIDPADFPPELFAYVNGFALYDSSSSPSARVYFIAKENGYFLKTAAKGTLKTEADMTAYFNKFALASPVLMYLSCDYDYLLTKKVAGNDCSEARFLQDPKRLCDRLAEAMRLLHGFNTVGCPVKNHTKHYLAAAERNYAAMRYEQSAPRSFGFSCAKEAFERVQTHGGNLKADTLIHGDFCLPNVIFRNGKLSGFVDVGNGGVGDRHVDIFWALWSLNYNLKTNTYAQRFQDAYGRESIDKEVLRTIAAIEVFG